VHLLVSEQYIYSVMHGASIKENIKFASNRSNGSQDMGWWEDKNSILCVQFMQTRQQYSWLQSHL